MPQKYLPYGLNGTDPPETPEEQQQIKQHLDEVLSHPDNSTDAAAGNTEVWQNPPTDTQDGEYTSAAAGAAGAGDSSSGDTSQQQQQQQQQPFQQPKQQQQQQQHSHSSFPFKFTWLPPWLPNFHFGRRLQQAQEEVPQQQQQQAQDAPLAATAIPLLGPQATDPSAAAASSISTPQGSPQCPAGTVFNGTEGTCVSSTDAFSTSTEETPEITTVTLEVPAEQQAGPTPGAATAEDIPIDPGTNQTVVLGPDGVAIGVGGGGGSGASSGGVARAVEPYSGPASQATRTLTMIGNTKIKVGG